MDEPIEGEPTLDDLDKAATWAQARANGADMYRLLSTEQKRMVDRRIEWAATHPAHPMYPDLPDSPVKARLDVMDDIIDGIQTGRLEIVERRTVVINGVEKVQLIMDIHDVR